ncbi:MULTISPECIES: hypothetical protein [Lysinibacillus]|uniref:hypothetical protein n=1 Tax=Lysinibacillus TaxID=400634 RepID=UPI00214AB274|nr:MULTISPECIES: hypothetical protein [Lysinibacillus]UUV26381.1 hypothetical protein NP781_07190 [Lysinibacillus sp. FN11]UYB49262.1 hypothetical protein OCI51_09940 [Lysinibacillus capsici]
MALIGAGTETNPYEIHNVNDIVEIYSYKGEGVYFKLMNDISLPFNDSRFPIASFTGVLDGNGKRISGLYVNKSTTIGVGLFGHISNATIKNIEISNFNVMGEAKVGALAGESFTNCLIENVFTSGTISSQTYAPTGTSSKWSYAGGLIGFANNPVTYRNVGIRRVVVKAYSYVGVYQGYGNNSIFEQCYSYPLAGNMYAKTGGYGAFTARQNTADVRKSYYLDSVASSQGGILITDTQIKDQSQLLLFDFNKNWVIDSSMNDGYPIPKSFIANAIKHTVKVNSYTSRMNNSAWVNLIHPIEKAIQVGSHATPCGSIAFAEFISGVRAEINTTSSMKNLDSYSYRMQIIKSIDSVVSYMNKLTGQAIVYTNIKPTELDTLTQLFENANDVDFIPYFTNDLNMKENSNAVSTFKGEISSHQLNTKTEVNIVAYIGDTVRLKVNFKTFDGTTIEPEDVKLKIYKPTFQNSYELISTISLSSNNKTENEGEYLYDYTIPQNLINFETNFLIYEFSGMYNNNSTLARSKIDIRFV